MRSVVAALLCCLVLALGWFGAAHPASAHEFRAGVLSLAETGDGVFAVQWRAPYDGRQRELMQVRPAFPEHCTLEGGSLDCGAAGLVGPVTLWGLEARSVNCWPSPDFDLMAVNQWFAKLIPAAFYYKTFKWPDWHLFEPSIRRAAGLASAPARTLHAGHYETRNAHCDVLVIGAGLADWIRRQDL